MNTRQTLLMQAESAKNTATAQAAIHLADYTDQELFEMVRALAGCQPFPPLWHEPLPLAICPLIFPTINAELLRRWEVAALEGGA